MVNTTLSESKADKMANMDSKSNGVEVKRKVSKLTSKRHFTVVEPFSFTIRFGGLVIYNLNKVQ
jgi:hypothetical protein